MAGNHKGGDDVDRVARPRMFVIPEKSWEPPHRMNRYYSPLVGWLVEGGGCTSRYGERRLVG